MWNFKKQYVCFLMLIIGIPLLAQEKIMSDMESYYDFLALDGFTERAYLNYHTLSDSKWTVNQQEGNIWKQQIDFQKASKSKALKMYGPECLLSYNSTAPYGQNDGLLWQGKGLNAYLSAGLRFEKYGFELTLKPEVTYSMNQNFDFMPPDPVYSGSLYDKKAAVYGYYGKPYLDAPQRFGNKAFASYGWGDSEIRYSYKAFTVGFGSQYAWVGPSRINPILHSNHAPSYPKVDIGIRKTSLRFGKVNIGEIEARLWVGQLRESDYFDNDESNNKMLYSALSIGYAPSFLKGLVLTANRNYLSHWKTESLYAVLDLFYIPWNLHGSRDVWDQRASIGLNYLLPVSGFEVYTEIGLNDYSPSIYGYIRYPFHSMVYTSGMRKSVPMHLFSQHMRGELMLEVSNLEMSQDFQFQWPATFYAHHEMKQGYTNRGQWLGAGNGTGGNSQYIGFKVYHQKGYVNIFGHRTNPDNDYIYQYSVNTELTDEMKKQHIKNFKAVVSVGLNSTYFIRPNLQVYGGAAFIVEHNPLYDSISWIRTSTRYGFQLQTSLIYHL
ncbi:MAG TPA: hypothetical protein PLO29_05445 [Paludibacter sp.]|jgi:hypothetical protein|nr:MAG: hypothetical protein BWY08_02001 [Bacteroidetes bacterium ADurb.Bin174]HQB28375.1 hypothetical protein [Paludibacter sp.]